MLKIPTVKQLAEKDHHNDDTYWETPDGPKSEHVPTNVQFPAEPYLPQFTMPSSPGYAME
jgi:hypothetical protein